MKLIIKILKYVAYVLFFIILLSLLFPNYLYWNSDNKIIIFSDYLSGLMLVLLLTFILIANTIYIIKDKDVNSTIGIGLFVVIIILSFLIRNSIVQSFEEDNWKLEYKSKKLKITNLICSRTIEYKEIVKYEINIVKKFSSRGSDYWQMKIHIKTKQNDDIYLCSQFNESLFYFIEINHGRISKLYQIKDELLNEYHNAPSTAKLLH